MDCNIGSHKNSDTEVILATTELEGESENDTNVDFVDDASVSVQNEICRGNKLRNEKPRYNETVSDRVCLGPFVKQPRRRKGHLDFSNINKRPSTPRSRCLCSRPNSIASTYLACSKYSKTNLEQTKTKKGKRCSLRIAELAVPSKRKCIETWREKSNILPGFMVERLKQHVMDQMPLVKIQEAIYCFQSGKRVSSKKCSFKWLSCKQKQYEAQKPSHQMDARMLCILFAHRVSQRLSRPLKLTLNSNLEKISNIVSKDIVKLMYKCLGTFSKEGQYKAVHTDVTNKTMLNILDGNNTPHIMGIIQIMTPKDPILQEEPMPRVTQVLSAKDFAAKAHVPIQITFWITGILEDSYFKLLEEDLRVKMKTEAITQTMLNISKPLVAIAKSVIEQENLMKSRDLEEEEGPVLDFIDDVVDNVMNICVPPQLYIDSDSSYSSGSKQDIMGEESEKSLDFSDKKNNSVDSTDSLLYNNLVLSNLEHFRNEIGKILYNITKESGDGIINGLENDIEEGSRDNTENYITDGNDEEFLPMEEMEYDTSLKAGIDHDLDIQTNNAGISLAAGIVPRIDARANNTGIPLEGGIEHDFVIQSYNSGISLEAGIEHDIDIRTNSTEITLEAGIEHDRDLRTNNTEISLEAGIEYDIDIRTNSTEITLEAGIEHDRDLRTNNTEISLEAGIEHDIDIRTNNMGILEAGIEHDIDIPTNNTEISLEAGIEHDINIENFDQINEDSPNVDASDNADKIHSNVSERFEIVNDDSKTDLVTAYNLFEKIKTNTTEEQKANKHKKTQWNSQNNKSNIIFAEPNEDLLSDADESWPTDFGDRPMLKVSDSASKSVSSLGRITEHDENIMWSPEEDETSMVNKGTGDTRLQVNAVKEILDSILPTGKHDTASQLSDPLMKTTIETRTKDLAVKQVGSKSLDEKYSSKIITVTKTNHDRPVDESFKLVKHQMESEESKRESCTADTTEDYNIIEKMRSKVDLGWKVHLKTAPSWVHGWGQGRGEPSEDSIPIEKRPTKVRESELRVWCKNLEKAFINLEIWSDWISNTCKESLSILKQKQPACPCLAKKSAINWMRLKKNVHKDALLWTKLYQRTDNNFKNLKRKYNNVEYSNPTPVSNNTIFEKMREFEELRVELHKMIVAAEYCAMCTCVKTKTTYNLNKECRGHSTKRKDNIYYTTCRHA